MTTASIKLYDILIDQGIDRTRAREAVNEFLTREEAEQVLVTRDDFHAGLNRMIMWIAGMFLAQIGVSTGIMALLLEIAG